MSQQERWISLSSGKIILHTENDGHAALRHGLDPKDREVTVDYLKDHYPSLYKEAVALLTTN